MRIRIYTIIVTLGLILVFSTQSFAAKDSTIVGAWMGALDFQGRQLRIVFNIKQGADGLLTATMDSPDQGSYYLPVDSIIFDSNKIHIVAAGLGMVVDGEYLPESSKIRCEFVQGEQSLPLVLEKTDKAPTVNRPQNPVSPFPYDTVSVKFENAGAGVTLAGTLTLPQTPPPHPAVVMITGSGAQDRDETVFGHKPFWVIADYLSRRGVAVLRYDDRGYGQSTGDFKAATSEDFAGDVRAAVEFLKKRSGIDPSQIGLIGHSEGAIIAPMVAAQNPDIAFAVLLAASGVLGEEILYEQMALINKANGISDSLVSWNRSLQEEFFKILKAEPNIDSARIKIREMAQEKLAQLSENEIKTLGLTDQEINAQIMSFTSPWFKAFLTYDPIPTLQRVKCPLLVLFGEIDLQTPPEQNASMIEQALIESGHKDYTVKILPKMNHLFQTASVGSPKVYGIIPETFSPVALETMSEWILERVR